MWGYQAPITSNRNKYQSGILLIIKISPVKNNRSSTGMNWHFSTEISGIGLIFSCWGFDSLCFYISPRPALLLNVTLGLALCLCLAFVEIDVHQRKLSLLWTKLWTHFLFAVFQFVFNMSHAKAEPTWDRQKCKAEHGVSRKDLWLSACPLFSLMHPYIIRRGKIPLCCSVQLWNRE